MSMVSSIMARLGLDTKGFEQGLQSAERRAAQSGATISKSMSGQGATFGLASGRRVAKGAASIEQMILGGDIATMGPQLAASLARMFKMPVGALLGITAAGVGMAKVIEASGALREANIAAMKPVTSSVVDPAAQGAESLRAQIAAIDEQSAALDKARSYAAFYGDQLKSLLIPQGVKDFFRDKAGVDLGDQTVKSTAILAAMEARRGELQKSLVASIQGEVNQREAAAHISAREAEMLRIQAEYQKKIADLQANSKTLGTAFAPMRHAAEYERDLAKEQANIRFDAQMRAITLESQLVDIQREGGYVSMRSAEARRDAAQEAAAEAQTGTKEQKAEAAAKLNSAKLARDEAERAQQEAIKTAKAHSLAVDLTAKGYKAAAEQATILANAAIAAAQAIRTGSPQQAGDILHTAAQQVVQSRLEEFRHPERAAAAAQQQRADERDTKRMEARNAEMARRTAEGVTFDKGPSTKSYDNMVAKVEKELAKQAGIVAKTITTKEIKADNIEIANK